MGRRQRSNTTAAQAEARPWAMPGGYPHFPLLFPILMGALGVNRNKSACSQVDDKT